DLTIERAEVALGHADVRVVDVAVDDVGDDFVRMLAAANRAGELAEDSGRRLTIQLERLGSVDTLPCPHFFNHLLDRAIDHKAGSPPTARRQARRRSDKTAPVPPSPRRQDST